LELRFPVRILVLTPNQENYNAAFYQQDFLDELARQSECAFYGPGYPGYHRGDTIADVLAKSQGKPDVILSAHGWLRDNPSSELTPNPKMELNQSKITKVAILNKEYSRLAEKLGWISESGFNLAFSHHDAVGSYEKSSGISFKYWPLAYNPGRFQQPVNPRRYDLGFSGILRNPTFPGSQSPMREKIQKELFFNVRGVPLTKRRRYRDLNILWRTWSGQRPEDFLRAATLKGKLSEGKYIDALQATKIWLNTPSPLNIVSTRYFECMASGAVVLAARSRQVRELFPRNTYLEFSDMVSFRQRILDFAHDEGSLAAIASRAQELASKEHTWQVRVNQLISQINKI
jgi:hypothetical protein